MALLDLNLIRDPEFFEEYERTVLQHEQILGHGIADVAISKRPLLFTV